MANPINTEFVDGVTVISEAWLDGINDYVNDMYALTGQPTSAADLRTNIGAVGLAETPSKIQPLSVTCNTPANTMIITLAPTSLDFRSATVSSGTVTNRTISAAVTLTISSGSELGTANGVASTFVVLAFDTGSTIELGIARADQGFRFDEKDLKSTTAEGGAGGADSASIIYSTNALTNRPYRVVGYFTVTQATKGLWVTAPTVIQGAGGANIDLSHVASNLASDGYYTLPGGLIVQWGIDTTNASGTITITLPIAFPNAHFVTLATASNTNYVASNPAKALTTTTIYTAVGSTGAGAATGFKWIAIGY